MIDWQKRIKNYPENIKQIYEVAFDKFRLFQKILDDDQDFEVTIDNKAKGEELYNQFRMDPVLNCPTIKTIGHSDFDPFTTFKGYMNEQMRL